MAPATQELTPLAAREGPQSLEALVRGRVQAGAPELPPMPPLAAAVLQIAGSPAFSVAAAVEILRRDPRLPSLLIRAANAEPYAGPVPAASLEPAIARLGARGVSLGLVELAARPVMEARSPRIEPLFHRPWQHALAVAFVARRLAQLALPDSEPAHAYQAGLLRDVGRPLVAGLVADTQRRTRALGPARTVNESTLLACIEESHALVRARLVRAWRLPVPVIRALAPDAGPPAPLGAAVHLAGLLADLEGFHLQEDDLARAQAQLPRARAALGVDQATTDRAVQHLAEWVLARG